MTLYEAIGGEATLRKLVDAFYNRVVLNPVIGPFFPEDIDEVKRKQYLFLTQFTGGPGLFTAEFGHPMMRARHMRFPITPEAADNWLACMRTAMDDIGLQGPAREAFFERLTQTAHFMVNTNPNEQES